MQEPSLEGLQAPTITSAENGDTTEYTVQQKLAVTVCIAAIGAYVGYSLMESYKADPPQAIWFNSSTPNSTTAAHVVPQIAFVNLCEEARLFAREGLHGWLDLHEEVKLTFPTVMFVEEDETTTFAEISGDVRRATLFAHKELRESQRDVQAVKSSSLSPSTPPSPSSVPPPLCTVVYRSVAEVEGQPLEDWDVEAPALRRWHGKSFTQRHCLGFTVDGLHVMLLMQDVEGILLTSKSGASTAAHSSLSSFSKSVTLHDGAALLRECGVPSTKTFDRWWPPAVGGAAVAASTSMMAFESSCKKEEKLEAMKAFAQTGRLATLWRSAFPLFSLLGMVLRYNRADFAVYPKLLSTAAEPTTITGVSGGLWNALTTWPQRLSLPFMSRLRHSSHEGQRVHRARRTSLSAPFLILARAAEGSAPPSPGVLEELQTYTARWVRHFAGLAPKHEASLIGVQREKDGVWGLRVDLTRVSCTVVDGACLMAHLVGLCTAVGVSLSNVRLVAVPEGPLKGSDSLLYPTDESEHVQYCWKPSRSYPSKSSAVNAGAKPSGTSPATSRHPGWISVEVRGEKKMGFVVAQHDFASL